MEYKKILLPDDLTIEAERFIKKVIDWLKKSDKLNTIDEGALRILTDSYDQYIRATERVREEGMTVPGSRSSLIPHPCVKIAKDSKSTCISLMTEIGLTLKSRSKISNLDQDTEESPLQELMKNL